MPVANEIAFLDKLYSSASYFNSTQYILMKLHILAVKNMLYKMQQQWRLLEYAKQVLLPWKPYFLIKKPVAMHFVTIATI